MEDEKRYLDFLDAIEKAPAVRTLESLAWIGGEEPNRRAIAMSGARRNARTGSYGLGLGPLIGLMVSEV